MRCDLFGLRPFPRAARVLILLLLCGLYAPALANAEKSVFVKGTFQGMETGDLTYLLIKTQGKTQAYACDATIIDAITGVQPQLPIIVEYVLQKEYNEGAGEEVSFEVVKSVFIQDEYSPGYGIRIESTTLPAQ